MDTQLSPFCLIHLVGYHIWQIFCLYLISQILRLYKIHKKKGIVISGHVRSPYYTYVCVYEKKMVTLFNYFERKEDSLPNSEGPVSMEVLFHQLLQEFLDHGSENGPIWSIWSNLVHLVQFGPNGHFHLVQWKMDQMDHFLNLPCKWRKIQAKRLNTIKGRKKRTKGELSKSLCVFVCVSEIECLS